ncbi:MAG: PadR family transcriptional regulator [Candidatus Saccharimonadales bacterium]|jgi:PadR family transcriptional regulator PadR|nr:PadR family transcriptional regulator, regulatory protein PadR [Patescibacteria group bacterium]
MDENHVDALVNEWDEVYKKGQLSLWVLLSIFDQKKYAAEISDYMYDVTGGTFEVKEQSLYRALRRFKGMGMVSVSEEDSPNGGPKRKFYELTPTGREVLVRFVRLHISPLMNPAVFHIITSMTNQGDSHESNA